MELYFDKIIKIAGVISALGAIVAILKKIGLVVKGNLEIKDTIKEIAEDSRKNKINILRLTLMNPEMPISERIIAGQEYIDAGGNGDAKKYYQDYLCHLHEDKDNE